MMKKLIRNTVILALAAALLLTGTALAETITSPVFHFPTVQQRPTEAPTAEPTEAPTAEPTVEPTAEPTAVPTAEPLPELTLLVSSNLAGMQTVSVGTEMVLTLTVEGAGDHPYTIQWQQSVDGGATWTDVPGANGHEYSIILDETHSGMYWRVNVELVPAAE